MKRAIILLIATSILAACNSSNFKSSEAIAFDASKDAGQQSTYKTDAVNQESNKNVSEQKVIRTANINGIVKDYEAFYEDLNFSIKNFDAYISNAEEFRSSTSIENKFEIKVPSSNFESTLLAITNKVDKVKSRKIKSTDVTAAVLDLESRLNTKTKMIKRYQDFIKQAKNIEEILKVEEHIRVLQEEIEATKARLKYFSEQVTYSTIHLHITKHIEQPIVAKSFGFFRKMKVAFLSGWESMLIAIIGLTYAWPFWLFMALVSYTFYFFVLRKRNSKPVNA